MTSFTGEPGPAATAATTAAATAAATAATSAATSAATGGTASTSGSIWVTRRAVVAHLALAIWVPGCAVAAWWQVGIALGGDSLGWVYSVMWPCFAIFGLVFWWFLVHDDPDRLGARGLRRQQATTAADAPGHDDATGRPGPVGMEHGAEERRRLAQAEAEDPELAEYNAYLAALADQDKSWRRQ